MAGAEGQAGAGRGQGAAEDRGAGQARQKTGIAEPADGSGAAAALKDLLAGHADWSVDPRKRWIATARRTAEGWEAAAPRPVGEVGTLFDRLLREAEGAPVALGVDMPLGLPRAFAARHAGAADGFLQFLRGLAERPGFFEVCTTLDEVGPNRPFYPSRGLAGMTRAGHAAALGLASAAALSRACDRATPERPAGAPLFWTLGANQSGKAALHAWRTLLLPALAGGRPPRLWPFEGALRDLLAPGRVVLAETYPAEALRHLGLQLAGSKRRHADRVGLAAPLLAAMAALGVAPDPALGVAIAAGFGVDAAGEDRLDCVLGLLCVINVLEGNRPDTAPEDVWVHRWEGWVLGQTAQPLA